MYYEPDDVVGLGDLRTVVGKAQKGVKKLSAWVRKIGRKTSATADRVSATAARVSDAAASPVDQSQVVLEKPTGGDLLRSPWLLIGGAVLALLLLRGTKGGR